jgi:hypothetical protein
VVDLVAQYNDLIKIIEEAEKNSTKVDINIIDISGISLQQEGSKPLFKDLFALVSEAESDSMDVQHRAKPRQILQMQSTQSKQNAMQEQYQEIKKQAQSYMQQSSTQTEQMQKETASNEIGEFADNLKQESTTPIKEVIEPPTDEHLVLPNLSIADQISELERIIEGIKEHVFDNEQIAIIKKEINGLSQMVEKGKGSYTASSSDMDQPLLVLRDMRLAYAKAMIRDANV